MSLEAQEVTTPNISNYNQILSDLQEANELIEIYRTANDSGLYVSRDIKRRVDELSTRITARGGPRI